MEVSGSGWKVKNFSPQRSFDASSVVALELRLGARPRRTIFLVGEVVAVRHVVALPSSRDALPC